VLIGPRASGKTTLGRLLAAELGLPFHDGDEEVERESGRSVADLLRSGELRARERQVLARLLAGGPAVLATGGGAVLWEGLKEACRDWVVVWLDAPGPVLAERIRNQDLDRPSLTGAPADEEAGAVARERRDLYEGAADLRLDSNAHSPETLARKVTEFLRSRTSPGG
jgi:shikimate kinase